MGLYERKEREKEQRRNSILDAAEKMFFSKGLENTTMDEVAEKAELSKGTLYLYFKNKNDLFHGVVARALDMLYNLFKTAKDKEKTGLGQIKAIGAAYYEFYKKEPNYFAALLHQEIIDITPETLEDSPSIALCKEIGERVFLLIKEAVMNGVNDGSLRKDADTSKLPLVLWGLTAGVLHILKSKENVITTSFGIDIDSLWDYSFRLIGELIAQ
jgi:TetR/AcrR family transcriptional regulator